MIKELILENYIPLMSSGIKKLKTNPAKVVNFLISKNGTGKSTLLRQLNPLPPDNADFGKNGRKCITIEDNHLRFVLDSYTGKGNGHSFMVYGGEYGQNGKELNTGGTLTAQKELVWNFFKLNSALDRVLSGIKIPDRLSTMSALRRKEIFMSLYPNDTTYAVNVYLKLKDERNSLKGAIKNQIARYTEEKRKLDVLSGVSVEELQREIDKIDGVIRDALLLRGSLSSAEYVDDVQNDIATMERLATRLLTTRLTRGMHSLSGLREELVEKERLLDYNIQMVTRYETMVSERQTALAGFDTKLTPEEFRSKLDIVSTDRQKTEEELAKYQTQAENYPVFKDEHDWEGYYPLHHHFERFLFSTHLASDGEITGGQYKGWEDRVDYLGNYIRGVKQHAEQNRHKLKHYESAELVDCPDCKSKFKVGITQADIDALRKLIQAQDIDAERCEAELKDLTVKLDNDRDWFTDMNRLFGFLRENGSVRVLQEIVKEYGIGKQPAEYAINGSQNLVARLKLQRRLTALVEEENLLKARLAVIEKNSMGDILAQLGYAETRLAFYVQGRRLFSRRVDALNRRINDITNYEIDVGVLLDLKANIESNLKENGRYELRGAMDSAINTLTPQKNKLSTDIIRFSSLTSVVESIDEDIKRLKTRLKKVEILMNGLCPNKGLIGKLMSDFINTICANMNAEIREVWSGPLFIKPCSKENGDLTYKFPVINGDNSTNSDVVDCSAGEADMIDFAFRKTILKYHEGYPLFMDEVGVSFDEINREKFFKYIEKYTAKPDASQMFIVSHYISQYGLFNKPNIISINSEGLTIKGDVNTTTQLG